jgi:formylglycine-generating enzyme required for sulfatase activity
VSEWDLPLNRGGIKTTVGEYSVSAVGPGPKAIRHWNLAKEAGLKTIAKVQLNNSWEISTVPYLPVMDLVAEHCRNLASKGIDGMMLSWTLGGYPSPNLEIAARFRADPTPGIDEVLDALAARQYGAEGAPLARKAWTAFSTAFREYPFDGGLMYCCPVHVGPANPLYLEETGYAATMTGIPYDDVTRWRGPYPVDVFISQFEKLAEGWRSGIPLLKAAVENAPPERRAEGRAELRYAQVAAIHFQSVADQTRFTVARDKLADSARTLSVEERSALRNEIRRILQSEIVLACRLFALAQEDSRIGFEAANQYFYVPLDLVSKVVNCRWLLEHFTEREAEDRSLLRTDEKQADRRQISNSIGMRMVLIPTGEFMMGNSHTAGKEAELLRQYDSDPKPDSFQDEYPRHRVRITRPFYMGTCHVTVGQFRRFVDESGYQTDAEKDGKGSYAYDGRSWKQKAEYTWRNPAFAQTADHPVVCISWNDAAAFCEWIGRKEGKAYRLPTEAEWEYACRAGTTTRYSCGDDPEGLAQVGNIGDAAAKAKFPGDWKSTIHADDGHVFTAPVGSFRPNAFGLYDMHGNAWQWCADWYGDKYYAASPVDDPTGPSSGTLRVPRGGSWYLGPDDARSAARYGGAPDARYSDQGFRVVRTP